MTITVEAGVPFLWVRNEDEFCHLVGVVEEWHKKDKHSTLRTRSRPKARSWGVTKDMERIHFLQGLPGIGPDTAEAIVKQFGGLPLRWSTTREGMKKVAGVGPTRISTMGGMIPFMEDDDAES